MANEKRAAKFTIHEDSRRKHEESESKNYFFYFELYPKGIGL
jgi:hypothetical protein